MKKTAPTRNKLKVLMVLTFAAGLITATAIGMVFMLHMKDSVESSGTVKSVDHADIVSPANGLLVKIHKKEGDSVAAGDLLLEINSEELEDRLLQLNGQLAEEQALLNLAQSKLALTRQNPLPDKLWHVLSETKINLAHKKKCQTDLERSRKLFQRKIIAEKTFQDTELAYEKACLEYEKSCKLKQLIEGGLAENIIKNAESEVNLVKTRIGILKQQITYIQGKIASCKVLAPHQGTVQHIPETIGLPTRKNDFLIKIVWGKKKFIRVKVHENSIQDIAQNQPVVCYSAHYDRLLTGAFKGKVLRILSEVNDNSDGRFYEVDIKLLEEPKTLRLGSSVDVKIITGRKTIFNALTKNY